LAEEESLGDGALVKARTKIEGTLLDAVLQIMDTATRTTVRKFIKNGRVAVDGELQTRPDFPVIPGQTVEIAPRGREHPPFAVLFEDDHILVVDKAAGLLSIATDKEQQKTLYRMVSDYVKEATGGRGRIFIVHRLDRDVSGVMVFAKDETTKQQLQKGWAGAEKIYHAVVEGRPDPAEGTVRNWLRENRAFRVYACGRENRDAKVAVTHYRVLKSAASYCTVEVRIETGRKHQIRVHMAGLGCPIVGDDIYGTAKSGGEMALHAHSLTFDHPSTGRRLTITSPPPSRFRQSFRSGSS
jgi:23S rRNA pseudouridine1911/1915/1917 synthase